MNDRQRTVAILNYQNYDRMPVVHFRFWKETRDKWVEQGHIAQGHTSHSLGKILGFDYGWENTVHITRGLLPCFEFKILEEMPDGTKKAIDENGLVVLVKDGVSSIPSVIDYTLKNRQVWEKDYKPRLEYKPERVFGLKYFDGNDFCCFDEAGIERLKNIDDRQSPIGLECGSLFGMIRDWLGVEGSSYLYMDDEDLYDEIIDTVAQLAYRCIETALKTGVQFDYGHFWEDICFKNGPLVIPSVFDQKVGPYYKKITDLLNKYGVNIVSLDCDGLIDSLIPTWLENGVNTMFPIEVGTWHESIAPWRKKYGQQIRGVGGMDKKVFATDIKQVDAEIERLKPLVDLGGFIPCPDHLIAPDAEWDNVRYYCDKMHETFE